jgi:Phosphotransferase enzyme family
MDNSAPAWFRNLQISDLQPIVRQVLNRPTAELVDWKIQRMGGGVSEYTGRSFGIFRVNGTARVDDQEQPWSAVVKVFGPSDHSELNDAAHPGYWKREVLAYQSGLLWQLPGGVTAPRCYAIQELPDGVYCVWLEMVRERDGQWTREQHHRAAHHLGRFNGAYLTGLTLPEADWFTRGRISLSRFASVEPDRKNLLQYSETSLGRWLSKPSIERMMRLWEQREGLFAGLDRLPTCFCHHDAFRRNLMLRPTADGTDELVAIDWSFVGSGKVGQETAMTTTGALEFLEVPAANARELDQAVFDGYVAGLREAGWQGDLQPARFGYTATAALNFALANVVWQARNAIETPEEIPLIEAVYGHRMEVIIEHRSVLHPFLLDLGDEALALMGSV